MAPLAPAVTVVVVTYNSAAHIGRCLAALAAQSFQDFEVVVIDNASADGGVALIPTGDPRLRLVALDDNVGFAAANNMGIAMARAPLIATLNPDAFAAPDWLGLLVAAAERHPSVAMFGSTQLVDGDDGRLDGIGDCYSVLGLMWREGHGRRQAPPTGTYETFSPCAAAALWRRDAVLAAGGFDEKLFCYCEDVDLGFRLRLRGHRCLQVAQAMVRHVGGASSDSGAFARFHGTRNRLRVFVCDMPGPLMWLLLPLHLLAHVPLLAANVAAGRAQGFLPGLWAGLRQLPRNLNDRRTIQASRTAPVAAILGAMVISPLATARRRAGLATKRITVSEPS